MHSVFEGKINRYNCSTLIVIILPSVTIMAMCTAFNRIPFWEVNDVSLAYLMASAVFVLPFVYLEGIHINGSSPGYYDTKTLLLIVRHKHNFIHLDMAHYDSQKQIM